ncbi:T9SS type A sorting domain-containing protein [Winogradskyella eckloniae]|uniref:T9SS type A sorting domain-containing protein n=1 Tax=Winogradskyella eckloniae TaxID=1089306 RepID=UPI001566030F|nr:T9SS type A sorting domain-containing protein [Winogradskyella eckloniae]NRD20612.1 T9SS type A sorting domain-containing protein [Winogradskyella eckloniae]
MKKYLFLVSFALCYYNISGQDFKQLIAEGSHSVDAIVTVAESHFDSVGRERGKGYKPFRRWQYFAERAMDENGMLKSPAFYYNELNNYNASINNEGFAARTVVGTWEEMGPTYWNATSGYNPGVGRITSVSIDENNLDHIIVGSVTGGVWKSIDGGTTWTVLTDNLANIDVYALTIDPNNSSNYFWGSTNGALFKSEDGGATWVLHSTLPGGSINKILIHPTDPLIMYCSSQGSGLYKSTDGGVTWSSIYFAGVSNGYDFRFKPNDPSVVYASGANFYVSTNNGASFNKISGVAPNQFSFGPKMIGVSANDPSVVYVLEASGGLFGALYKSTDSGNSFTKLSHDGRNYFGYDSAGVDDNGQAPRDMAIAVNPNNVDDVHIAGINTWRSVDGGVTFGITSQWTPYDANNQNIGYCHADVDLLEFVGSGADVKLYVASDGGIYRAENPTVVNSSYYTDLTAGLGIRQFYKIGVSQTNPVIVTGGSQDNGSSVLSSDGNWTDWWGADGMEGFVDKNNSQILYGTSQFGSFVKSFNGGANITYLTQPDDKGGDYTWNWIVPFEQDPILQNVIYCAFDEVYKSIDSGLNWVSISQNFSNNIDHLKIAPTNNNKIYLAINGLFWSTDDGGITWTQSALNLSGGQINSIAVHPQNPNKIAIATTNNQKVYVSDDSGSTWTSIKWDLPNFSSQAVVWQSGTTNGLYVGMNYGVYYTDTTLGNSWTLFNNGLPNVRINELEINSADNKLYAATYGRGLWRSNLYDQALSVADFEVEDLKVYPNPASNTVNLYWDTSENVTVRLFNSLGQLMYYSKNQNLSTPLTIETSGFETGIYFVKLNSTKGTITKKLMLN